MHNLYHCSCIYHDKSVSLSELSSSELLVKFLMSLQSQIHWAQNCKGQASKNLETEASVLLESSVSLKWLLSTLPEADILAKPLYPQG